MRSPLPLTSTDRLITAAASSCRGSSRERRRHGLGAPGRPRGTAGARPDPGEGGEKEGRGPAPASPAGRRRASEPADALVVHIYKVFTLKVKRCERKRRGRGGVGRTAPELPPTPVLPPRALPPPRVGKITTPPGLRGRGEPGGSVRKQMSPLAAASASGESCAGGPSRGHSPPTSQASRSQLPRLGGGVFFRLSVSRVQLFYLGAVLTRPRLADVKTQPLHDSVIRDRGEAWRAPTPPDAAASAAPAAPEGARSPGRLPRGPRGLLSRRSW